MDLVDDLIAFNSPPSKLQPIENEISSVVSPGNNPFDTLLKVAEKSLNETNVLDMAFVEGATFVFSETFISDNNNKRESIVPRESLGILHINFDEKLDDEFALKDCLTPSYKASYRSFLKSISSSRSSESSTQPSTIYSIQNSSFHGSQIDFLNLAMSPTMIEQHLKKLNSPKRCSSVSDFEYKKLEKFRKKFASVPGEVIFNFVHDLINLNIYRASYKRARGP